MYNAAPFDCAAVLHRYHDEEWGRPLHDDTQLFELLVLEGAQVRPAADTGISSAGTDAQYL